jgi:hypothetical protein
MADSPRQVPLGLRIGLTVLLLGLYWFGARIPLPFVHPERFLESGASALKASVTTLGVNPLITGFLLVEIGSLLVTPGRRLRAQGWEGRRKLNRIALGASLALSFSQAAGVALFFERTHSDLTLPPVDQPGWLFRLIVTCTLTAVTAVIYLAGNFITTWGVGNGLCLLYLVSNVPSLLRSLHRTFNAPDDRALLDAAILAAIGAVVLLRVQRVGVTEGDETLEIPLPAFPQSIAPVNVTYGIFALEPVLPTVMGVATWLFLPSFLALVLFLSLLFFWWLGTRRRLAADLPAGIDLAPEADAALRRQFLVATGFLVAAPLLYWALLHYLDIHMGPFSFPLLLFTVATGLDLYAHVRFLSAHDAAPVLELDNVHLAAYLERRLAAHGIPALVQGYQARSLYLLFGPLFKMHLLVPAERLDEAEALLLPEIEEAVRAF